MFKILFVRYPNT